MNKKKPSYEELEVQIEALKAEIKNGHHKHYSDHLKKPTVNVPEQFAPIFDAAEETVKEYFKNLKLDPSKGTIEINDQRYVLVRASALSNEFFNHITSLYADRGEKEAFEIGKKFLFDIGHVLGLEDAKQFHKKMNVTEPIEKLSAGPVHFAYSGWAFVDILPESNPSPDENYFLKYHHPYSFEADSWMKSGVKSDHPVCIMNAAYSSGWCEESFGISLTAVEITCKAKGDDNCTFIMAPPDKIQGYIDQEVPDVKEKSKLEIPFFFERKKIEEQLNANLKEKEVLLKEIHHRVKNNLQIISSLLNLQFGSKNDPKMQNLLNASQNRVKTMSLVHEKLYGAQDLSKVQLKGYISSIIDLHRLMVDNIGVNYDDSGIDKGIYIGIDNAIIVGLVVNEMFSNSFKYAFNDDFENPLISASCVLNDTQLVIVVADNGKGIANEIVFPNEDTLGFELISALVSQIGGTIELNRKNGTEYRFQFTLS